MESGVCKLSLAVRLHTGRDPSVRLLAHTHERPQPTHDRTSTRQYNASDHWRCNAKYLPAFQPFAHASVPRPTACARCFAGESVPTVPPCMYRRRRRSVSPQPPTSTNGSANKVASWCMPTSNEARAYIAGFQASRFLATSFSLPAVAARNWLSDLSSISNRLRLACSDNVTSISGGRLRPLAAHLQRQPSRP